MYFRGNDPEAIHQDGKQINTAGWGFVNWLDEYILPILKEFGTPDIIAVWDGGNDYRTSLFPAYKAERIKQKAKQPAKLTQQLKHLEEAAKVFLANLGIVNVQCNGVEADDVIAALCVGLKGETKIIHTVDADLLQLSDPETFIFLKNVPVHGEYKDLPLNMIRLNKALVGDKSDGYGGVNRFGPKAWDSLVNDFGYDGMQEIEECLNSGDYTLINEAAEESGNKALIHLSQNLKDAKLGYRMSSLTPAICFQFNGNKLTWPIWYTRLPTRDKVMNVLNQMGCPDYFDKFEYLMPQEFLVTEMTLDDEMAHFLEKLEETPFVAFDYETVDTLKNPKFNEAMPKAGGKRQYIDVLSSKITGCSFNYGEDLQYTMYVSTFHKDTDNVNPDFIALCLDAVNRKGIPLVAHNCSFEWLVTKTNLDIELEQPYDTAIMSSYVNENEEMGLKSISERVFRYSQTSYKDTLEMAGAKDMADLTGEQVLSYGCDDSLVTAHTFKLFRMICQIEGTWEFYKENERAPVHVLSQAFDVGVRIDFDKMTELHDNSKKVIKEGTAQIRELLAEHCTGPNYDAAIAFNKADGDNLARLDRFNDKKGLSDDAMLAKKQERLLKWEAAAEYFPYSETYLPPEFLGTHTQLNIVAEEIGIDLEVAKLSSIANVRINEYVTLLKEGDLDGQQELFLTLLAESAGPALKKREGETFERLKQFCLLHLGEGKTVSEGDELNFNSPKQMQELLYCKLALPVRRRTKVQRDSSRYDLGLAGSPATNDEAFQIALAEDCLDENQWKGDLLRTLLDVKGEMTKISLYYRPYPLWVHPRDGMVHPQIRNCGTVTRRPTGGSPNVLQVEKGPTRAVFLPRHNDHAIVAMDFSGQELRITGSESRDPVLIDAYTGGGITTDEDGMIHPVTKDIHSVTAIAFAERIFKRELGTSDFDFSYDSFRNMLFCDDKALSATANLCRKMAKVVNFLIIYGGAASSLAMKLSIPEAFAEELYRAVFGAYDRLAPWQEETIQFAKRHGYVKTAYGNLKHLTTDIRSRDGGIRSRQERQAVNQTIQGCAADILKVVLTQSHKTNLWNETQSVMIAPVYDEIVASVPTRNIFEYCERLQDIMNVTPPGHPIPMMAEVCIGENWYAASGNELGDRPSEKKVMACIESFSGKEVAA